MFENPIANLSALCNSVRSSSVVRLSWSSHFFMQAAASKNASEQFVWSIHIHFVNFPLHQTTTKQPNFVRQPLTIRHMFLSNIFLKLIYILTSQNTDILSWITLYSWCMPWWIFINWYNIQYSLLTLWRLTTYIHKSDRTANLQTLHFKYLPNKYTY